MKSWINLIAVSPLLLMAAIPAFADLARPNTNTVKPQQTSDIRSRMRIEPNEQATEARLVIPRDVLARMKASLDGGSQDVAVAGVSTLSGTQTVMSGIFLSLALAFGGVWVMRSRAKTERLTGAALGIAVLALCGAAASIAYANAGPPPVARSLTSKILVSDLQWWGASGQVKVEVVDSGDQITLVLPRQKEQPR